MAVTRPSAEARDLHLSGIQWLLDHHHTKAAERSQMVADLGFEVGDRILDLGCGPGLWTSMFAQKVAPTGDVIGVDVSAQLIDHAVSRLDNDPSSDVIYFARGEFSQVPFRDRTFDAVFLGNCLSYARDPAGVIQEMKRVTRSNGRVVSKEFDDATFIFHPVDAHLTAKVLQAVTGALSGAHSGDRRGAHHVRPDPFGAAAPSVPHFASFMGRKTHGLFLEAGFENVVTKAYAMQKVPPLDPEATRYMQGTGKWLGETAAPHLCEEDRRRWEAAFDPAAREYMLDSDHFYFCMTEMITVGTVGPRNVKLVT